MFSSVQIWSSSRLVAHGFLDEMEDGIHAGESVLGWDTQILLNMYCNKHLSFNDGTCCTTAKQTTLIQVVVLAALITRYHSLILFRVTMFNVSSCSSFDISMLTPVCFFSSLSARFRIGIVGRNLNRRIEI